MNYVIYALTILTIIFEIVSAFKMKKAYKNKEYKKIWLNPYKLRWLFGAPLAIGSFFITYSVDGETEKYKILGFPIIAAAFDEAGSDYVSALTGPIMFGNAVIWYFLPWVILFILLIYLNKINLTNRSSGPANSAGL